LAATRKAGNPVMIRRRTLQLAYIVLSFTTIVFTITSVGDGGTQHWYLFFSPLVLAASFHGVRGALITGSITVFVLATLYRNALVNLQGLLIDPQTLADVMRHSPAMALLNGDVTSTVFGTILMLGAAVGMGYAGDRSRRLERHLAYMADHDALTGLVNRRRFIHELEREIALCRAERVLSTLLYIDLDGFKTVNDELGHAAGDLLLVDLAKLLRANMRDNDIVARMGGDEFALLMPGLDSNQALSVTSRLLQAVAGYRLPEGGDHRVTASIGLVRMNGAHTPSAGALLVLADEAMYSAKRSGKNQVHFATESYLPAHLPGVLVGTLA
jgi:diguanylate cyclase (GGDEF)-like protein